MKHWLFGAVLLTGATCNSAPAVDPVPSTQPDPVAEPEPEPVAAPVPRITYAPPTDRDPAEKSSLWLADGEGDISEDLWGESDPELERLVLALLDQPTIFGKAHAEERLSLVLVDITDPKDLDYAMVRPDWEIFTASLSKIAVMLGTVDQAYKSDDPEAFLAGHQEALDQMIKWSSNEHAIQLYKAIGHDPIVEAVYGHQLYDDETGGLWWSMAAAKQPSPKTGENIAGTARQVARYFLMMEQGKLVNPDGSRFIKATLNTAALAIFSQGIRKAYPDVTYYGKPGIYGPVVAEGLLIEGPHARYVLSIFTHGLDYQDEAIPAFGKQLHGRMLERHGVEPYSKDDR